MCARLKTARTARRIAESHAAQGLDIRAHAARTLPAAARTLISLPKSQDFQNGIDQSLDMRNHFRQGVDIVLVVGDYWGVLINGDMKAKEGHHKPEANRMQQLGLKRC